MPEGLILRPLTLADASALHQALWPDRPLAESKGRVETITMAEGRARLWGLVAEASGEIVGFGQLTRWGWRGEICNLIVRENWRGKGIGTALIGQLIEIARQSGLREVEIGGAEANPRALALYRRLGFQDERRVSLDLGDGNEPVIYLLLRLDGVVPA